MLIRCELFEFSLFIPSIAIRITYTQPTNVIRVSHGMVMSEYWVLQEVWRMIAVAHFHLPISDRESLPWLSFILVIFSFISWILFISTTISLPNLCVGETLSSNLIKTWSLQHCLLYIFRMRSDDRFHSSRHLPLFTKCFWQFLLQQTNSTLEYT